MSGQESYARLHRSTKKRTTKFGTINHHGDLYTGIVCAPTHRITVLGVALLSVVGDVHFNEYPSALRFSCLFGCSYGTIGGLETLRNDL